MDVETAGPDDQSLSTLGRISADAAFNKLNEVLAQVEVNPENVPLLRQQICLMRLLDMRREVLELLMRMSSLVMLSEGALNIPYVLG